MLMKNGGGRDNHAFYKARRLLPRLPGRMRLYRFCSRSRRDLFVWKGFLLMDMDVVD